jgi:hypothetical protein
VILQSFRSGATEFLRQPLVESEIASVFAKIELSAVRPEDSHLGRVIAVYASKGWGLNRSIRFTTLSAIMTSWTISCLPVT